MGKHKNEKLLGGIQSLTVRLMRKQTNYLKPQLFNLGSSETYIDHVLTPLFTN